jgi:hypothetical protein
MVTRLLDWLGARTDCELAPGLDEAELDRAEQVFGITMPPLWRAVLRRAHPVPGLGAKRVYPDWRLGDEQGTHALVRRPVEGVLFDVEQNGFWWHDWGPAPGSAAERLALAGRHLATVPRLTPLMGHWYVGSEDDSPVFSIVQTDLYVPARTLADLPAGRSQDGVAPEEYPIGAVPFWSELHAYSALGHHADLPFARLAEGGA